jgi:hypothetical protein
MPIKIRVKTSCEVMEESQHGKVKGQDRHIQKRKRSVKKRRAITDLSNLTPHIRDTHLLAAPEGWT